MPSFETDLATLIRQGATQRNLDPRAVLAVAGQEGLGGGIGDQGTSFGPFQLHYGGAYPSHAPQGNPTASQAWATSPLGVNYALDQIGKVAGGLSGRAAVDAIVHRFERPADPTDEASRAWAAYGGTPAVPGSAPLPSTMPQLPSTSLPQLPAAPSVAQPNITGAILGSLGKDPNAQLGALVNAQLQAQMQPPAQSLAPPVQMPGTEVNAPSALPQSGVPGSFKPGSFKPGTPVPTKLLSSIGAEHPTAGLDGFPAYDYMAQAGTPVIAPVGGKIVRFSGHDPRDGPVDGVHGPFGWSLYLQGTDGHTYYMTHLGNRDVKVGQKVAPGSVLGTIGDYAHWGGADHVHMGVR